MKQLKAAAEAQLPAAYRHLRARLGQIGWIARGSVLERTLPGQGGPRYQWSRRVQGKTVTVALSAEQFAWLQSAIANQRNLWTLLDQMNQLIITLRSCLLVLFQLWPVPRSLRAERRVIYFGCD